MRKKVSLYIGGKAVDLDDQSFILFNYTVSDLTNPTIVKNSFSQQVTILATPTNKKVMSNFGRSDRITDETNFNAMKRTDFVIYNDLGEILESGYVKLDSVARKGGEIYSYTFTMYGGLGGLFYGLSYDDEGNERTLADLEWSGADGSSYTADDDADFDVEAAWGALESGVAGDYFSIFNFVPMYNGLPSGEFDANKAVVLAGLYDNLPSQMVQNNDYYRPKGGVKSPYIITFENKHTEWEMADIRTYLQRPCVNVAQLLESIATSAKALSGKALAFDSSVLAKTNGLSKMWMSLPLLSEDYWKLTPTIGQMLENTKSPATYLIGLAKVFGWVFKSDPDGIRVFARDAFFNANDAIDLSKRIDTSSVSVSPIQAGSRFYDFALPGIGAKAELYKSDKDKEYGSVRVDTGYAFNDKNEDVLNGTPFKASANIAERSLSYISAFFVTSDGATTDEEYLPQTSFENVAATLYKMENGEITDNSTSFDLGFPTGLVAEDTALYEDWLAKFQAHDDDNKAEDGDGILMYFAGMEDSPEAEYDDAQGISIVFPKKRYYITGYDAARTQLNEGKECWDLRQKAPYITRLPSFVPGNGTHILQMAGNLVEAGFYDAYWKGYISDLYDKDTISISCKVNLSGLQVGEGLLQRFFWYEGALWVLNAIKNYSLTTYDLVDCVFVKVKDSKNYTNGQK